MSTKFTILAALLAALFLTAACGNDGDDNPGGATQTASNGDEFNDADVAFATDMIPHHAQALSMVDLTIGRELDPAVHRLAEDILAAQGPEIEQMDDWLTDWGKPVPETMRDHANAHGDGKAEMHSDMPGMMTDEEMDALEAAEGEEFERMWLEMMIEHHEGAIDMAGTQQERGLFAPAVELARSIEVAQKAEIETMKKLLAS